MKHKTRLSKVEKLTIENVDADLKKMDVDFVRRLCAGFIVANNSHNWKEIKEEIYRELKND